MAKVNEQTTLTARVHGVTEEGVYLALWGKVLLFEAAVDVVRVAAGYLFKHVRVTIEDRGSITAAIVAVEERPAS